MHSVCMEVFSTWFQIGTDHMLSTPSYASTHSFPVFIQLHTNMHISFLPFIPFVAVLNAVLFFFLSCLSGIRKKQSEILTMS